MGKKLKLQWVSDLIADDYMKWVPGTGVFIDCQTGTGKSYFVEHPLLEYCIQNKKTMLYLCNRINLKRQVKLDIAEAQGIDLSEYSMDALDNLTQIGICTIMTYHKIQNYEIKSIYEANVYNELIESQYDYVIMDEVQYINHDSSFVGKIQYFYNNYFPNVINRSVMIYLSANMDSIADDLLKVYDKNNNANIITYTTGRDYSYVTAYYFSDYDDLVNTINNDISGNKWMIFINSIDNAKNLQSKINDCKFICSPNNGKAMDTEILEEIILTQKFSCKCVIATKALDNGINVKDELLTNMVIITLNKIDFIQMLGRKRINIEEAQGINLYIHARGKKTFSTLLDKSLNNQLEKVELFKQDPLKFNAKYNDNHKKLPENLFYQAPKGGWCLNEIGYNNLLKQIKYCEYMIQKFGKGKLAYIFEQLNLLGLEYDLSDWISNVPDNNSLEELKNYLDKLVGKKSYKTRQQELINKINLRDSRNRQQKSINQFNEYFRANDINYSLKSQIDNNRKNDKGKKNSHYKETYWMLGKIDFNDVETCEKNVEYF